MVKETRQRQHRQHWWDYFLGMRGKCPRMQYFPGDKQFTYCKRKRHLSWKRCEYGPFTDFDFSGYIR